MKNFDQELPWTAGFDFTAEYEIPPVPIHERGFWMGVEDRGYHFTDPVLAQMLGVFFLKEGAKLIFDFGCGPGEYVRILKSFGLECLGFDGNPDTVERTQGLGSVLDLSEPFDLAQKCDWALCLEVGEHIPQRYEKTLLANLHSHNQKGIILSWAVLGQEGHGHVNPQENAYIKEQMAGYGYQNDLAIENLLREKATLSWFKNTLMVFRKSIDPTGRA